MENLLFFWTIRIFIILSSIFSFITLILLSILTANNLKYYCSSELRNYVITHICILFTRVLTTALFLDLYLTNRGRGDFWFVVDYFYKMLNFVLLILGSYVLLANSFCSSSLYYKLNVLLLISLPIPLILYLLCICWTIYRRTQI